MDASVNGNNENEKSGRCKKNSSTLESNNNNESNTDVPEFKLNF